MINQDLITAFDLSRLIKQNLELDIVVCKEVSEGSYFEFSPDVDTAYIANAPLWVIEENEKRAISTAVSHDILLSEAREIAANCSHGKDFSDCFLYCIFAILHEFGHLEMHRCLPAPDYKRLEDERGDLLAQLKTKLQIAANLGHDEFDSRRDYELGYRNIPFEKYADDYAKKLMPELLDAFIAKD